MLPARPCPAPAEPTVIRSPRSVAEPAEDTPRPQRQPAPTAAAKPRAAPKPKPAPPAQPAARKPVEPKVFVPPRAPDDPGLDPLEGDGLTVYPTSGAKA